MAKLMTKQEFIDKARKIHGDKYDYENSVPLGKRTKLLINCFEHGEFWQTQEHHLNGHGCPQCARIIVGKKTSERQTKTFDDFLNKARKIHGNKYDYSKVEYKNAKTKVCIVCPVHGEFWQEPCSHIRGNGCPKCGAEKISKSKMKTKENFVYEAQKVHGKKYDYSLSEYKGNIKKVCIICPKHGEFWQSPKQHLKGHGCSKCSKTKKLTKDEFVQKAIKIHGNYYDYSKVNYKNAHTKICIICPKHGEFFVTPNAHLNDRKCRICTIEINREKNKSSKTKSFIERSKKIHLDKYDYSKVDYINSATKVCIICPKHGEFWQTPAEHLSGCGCQKCKTSSLEKELLKTFEEHKIYYQYQKRFIWLGRKSLDFYLPEYNVAIECQGIQHFKPVKHFGGEEKFLKTKSLDDDKKNACSKNGINLIYFTHEKYFKKNFFHDKNELLDYLMKCK